MSEILIIDDEQSIRKLYSIIFKKLGHEVTGVDTIQKGVQAARALPFDVVFLDVHFPEGNGLEALPPIVGAPSAPEVIIMTGAGDPDGAALAVESGAWDYIQKSSSIKVIELALHRALQYREGKLERQVRLSLKRSNIIGDSPPMRACLESLAHAAAGTGSVLLTGETGTGKEVFARTIHENSARSENRFVAVDCAALPESLAEGILFGHEQGAYTGADRRADGTIKQADGGTLFLDEVGELTPQLQKLFLRVLEEHSFYPIGGGREVRSDFKLISATNRALEQMVAKGTFRKDLYYRLQSTSIHLPPLRERNGDVEKIVLSYLRQASSDGVVKGVVPEFLSMLAEYEWPGNVRELVNVLDAALAAAGGMAVLFPVHLPARIRSHSANISLEREAVSPVKERKKDAGGGRAVRNPASFPTLRECLKSTERQYLADLTALCQGDMEIAVVVSGMSRSRLYALMKKHGL